MILENVKPTCFLTGCYEVIDPSFGHDCQRIELDLGCGKGGFALELAKRNPDTVVLAADIKASRLKKINNKVAVMKLENVETLRVMAWDLIAYLLPDSSIDRIHILNPDPWPKSKHRDHRLLSTEFLGRIKKVLKPNGVLHLSTDDKSYFEFMKEAIKPLDFYEPYPEGMADVRDIITEFESFYLKVGTEVNHLCFILKKD